MAHQKVTVLGNGNVAGDDNTYTYSGSFNVFKGEEVVVTLDGIALTRTTSTINESASPREYTVNTTAKTIHIGGANLGSGNSIIIRPQTDMGLPTPRATFSPGASITSSDLNNNQLQLMRKAMEYDDTKMSSTGDTMTGHLTMGEDQTIIFEGATDDGYETTLTVADPTADRTITLPNVTGTVVTTGDTGSVATAMIADDAVDNDKLANSIVSAISANTAKVTNATHTGDVTGATSLTIANNAVTSAKIANGEIVNDDLNASAAIAHSKLANVTDGRILVGSGSNVPTAVAVSGDVTLANDGAVTIANDAVEIGMIGCEQTTISDSDSHLPTSGAVVDYVAAQLAPIGGLEVIADDESFPNTIPAAGVVISITDAAGLSVNSSGVSTNGDALDNSTITINGFPSELRGGVGSNADPYVFQSGAGLMVQSTGSSQTYNYHQALIRESDFVRLSDDIDDFNQRYRVAAGASGVRTGVCGANGTGSGSYPCDGDMAWFTGSSKMYVFDAPAASTGTSDLDAAWKEVSSVGDYKILTIKDHDQAVGGSGPTFNGSNEEFDLFDGSSDASVTSAQQLIVVLNGVIQKPNSGSFSGSEEGFYLNDTHGIKFCDPPPSSSTLFVTQIGAATTLSVPGNDTVTSAKIVNGAIMNVDVNASADIAGSKLADDSISHTKLDIHNAESGTDKFLAYTSNGMEWVVPADATKLPLAGGTITGDVVFDNSTHANADLTWDESDKALEFRDDVKAVFGDGTDIELYHSGGHGFLKNNTGTFVINADTIRINNNANNENIIASDADGAVKLYYNNVSEIETKSGGVKLNGHSECAVNALGNTASNPTFDFTVANYITMTLTGNVTVQNPTTESVGQSGSIIITQDGTGSRTCGWSNQFKWTGGTAPTLSTAAGAVDRIDYLVVAADTIHCVASLAVS